MKIYNTSGTIGDTYVNCCKLCNIKENIKLFHSQPYPEFNGLIREIYSLVPNISEVHICNQRKNVWNPEHPYIYSLSKRFPSEPEDIKMNFFPKFEFNSKYHFDFPYIVIQPKSGRTEQKREMELNTIERILKNSKYKVILIGTSKKYEKIKNCINLINKTTLFDAFKIIKNSKYFIGVFGIMTMVALSEKINSNFIYSTEGELEYRVYNTPWQKYCKKTVLLENYMKIEGSKIRLIWSKLYNKFFKIDQIISLKKSLKNKFWY